MIERDLVVVLPGIMGSTLVKDGREVWAPSAGSVVRAIASFGASVRKLTLPGDIGDDDPCDGVCARRLMPDLHLVPGLWSVNLGYDILMGRLRAMSRTAEVPTTERGEPVNLLAVPYDWRLSNRLNARRLKRRVEVALERLRSQEGSFAQARVVFVCHSMGGLLARWYIEKEQGLEVTRALITIGTPHRGALKALDLLVNGVRKGFGPFALDFTGFARSLPAAYQLLPEYACITSSSGLLKPTETTIPHLDRDLIEDAAKFHAELGESSGSERAGLRPIVGTDQATATTAAIRGEKVLPAEIIDGSDERGDATVPRLSATPVDLAPDSPVVHWVAACHGALQSNNAVLDQLEGILTARPVIHRASADQRIGVRVPDVALRGEEIEVEAWLASGEHAPLVVTVTDEQSRRVDHTRLKATDGVHHARLRPLPPGGYLLTVGGYGSAAARVAPVASPLVVGEPDAP